MARLFVWNKMIMQDIQTLNRIFSRDEQLQFTIGAGDMPFIQVNTAQASATIALHGAQILSFKPHNSSHDLFYLSEESTYQQGKAIRGGVPLCWPWFGDDPVDLGRPAHGFARNLFWEVLDCQLHNDVAEITLGLESTATSKQWWPGEFRLRKKIIISDQLAIALTTENRGEIAFSISQALHSYFLVGDIKQVKIDGLADCDYLDKLQNFASFTQTDTELSVASEVDRVYLNTQQGVSIIDHALHRKIHISHQGADNYVVWNPWQQAASLADMKAQDYQHFLCVESANALANSVIIAPGAAYQIMVNYQLES